MGEIAGLVLAAGASSRMGQPKALLRLGSRTFVEHVVHVLAAAGAAPVVVTRAELEAAVRGLVGGRARVVVNERPDEGMQSSIACGIDAVGDVDGLLLALVDQPAIRVETAQAVVARFVAAPDCIVVPRSAAGRRGHPVVFPRRLLGALREAHAEGARAVLWANAAAVIEVETDDPGPFTNVNTPQDLAALQAQQAPQTGGAARPVEETGGRRPI